MGDYSNGKLARTLGWATTALMTAAAIILFAFAHGGGLYQHQPRRSTWAAQ